MFNIPDMATLQKLAAQYQANTVAPSLAAKPTAAPAAAPAAAPGMSNSYVLTKAPATTPEPATPSPVTMNTTPMPLVPPAPPAAQAPAIPDLSGISLGNFNIANLSPGAAQAQADYQARNTYRLTKPTAGLTAAQTNDFQLRDGVQGFQFVTNKGNAADITAKEVNEKRDLGGAANPSGFVPYVEGAKYRIWNEKGKDRILYEGEGADALKKAYRYAQNLSATKGKKANWAVEMMDPATGQWSRVADDDPAKGVMGTLGKIAGFALPIATAFIPGLGVAGMIAAQTAAGAAGSALAGRDPLKGAIMGGLSAAGGSLLGPAIQGVGQGAARVGTTLGTAVGTGIGSTAGGLLTGQSLEDAIKGGLLSGGLSYASGELGLGPKRPAESSITAEGGVAGQTGAAGATPASYGADGITISGGGGAGASTGVNAGVGGALASTGSGGKTDAEYNADANEILIKAGLPSTGVSAPIDFGATPELRAAIDDYAAETDPVKKQSKLEEIAKYMRLAGLGVGLLGGLFGGKGTSGSLGKIPGGLSGGLNPVFTGGLPAANLPGLAAGTSAAARPMAGADWYRYGYGPEQSFFEHVPQGAPNTSRAFTGYRGRTGYAEGGEVDSDDARIARRIIDDLRGVSGGDRPEPRRRARLSVRPGYDRGITSTYAIEVPLGRSAETFIVADGRGLEPDVYTVGGRYRRGDLGMRAAHTLGRGSEYGISGPLLGGDFDVSAYADRGLLPRGLKAAYRRGFEAGGYAVGGPGDGRDDKIPAMLSDGEYVIDAETVAMLGNGSNKAGAEALDKLRVNVRKHKGRKLAKGDFSVNARKPEQYLKRGRA